MTADGPEPGAPAAADELETLRERVRLLEAAAAAAEERARGDAQLIRDLRARVGLLEGSTSFRLGHALVLGAKLPRRLAGVPAAAWRLWRGGRPGATPRASPTQRAADAVRTPAVVLGKLRGPAHQLSVIEAIPPPMPRAIESITDRVVYVLHNSLPWSSGGYATRAHGLAVGMASGGLEVICLTRPGYPLDIRQRGPAPAAVPLSETIEGIDYRRISAPRRTETDARGYMLAAADALEAEFRQLRPEWVVAASNHVTGLPALIAARRLGLPFLYEVRGFWEVTRQSREPGFERSETFSVIERLEAETARRADHVFTLTGPMRDELVRRGVDPGTISLLPNSSDPERFTPRDRDAALAARLGIPAPVPVIGYIGTFVQYEGLEDLVAACAVLSGRGRDFRLMLIGNENVSGTDKGPITAEIERIAAEAGLTDRLIMPGRVPHAEVAAYYSLIDIAPFPRKPQPVTEMVSPMKPLEALAMEKAVVVSSVAALVEMIADEKTGLVFAKGEVASLADALDRLIGDPGLRARLGRNGRDWVVRERTWSGMGQQVRATLGALGAGIGAETPPGPRHESCAPAADRVRRGALTPGFDAAPKDDWIVRPHPDMGGGPFSEGSIKYARGYVLSEDIVDVPPDWNRTRVESFHLCHDPRLPVMVVENAGRSLVLIGHFIDIDAPDAGERKILHAVSHLSDDDIIARSDNWAGRFVLVFARNGGATVVGDATGMRTVFYARRGPFIAASHARIVACATGSPASEEAKAIRSQAMAKGVFHFPGDLTPWRDVAILTANMALSSDRSLRRIWPRTALASKSRELAARTVLEQMQAQWRGLAHRQASISITAGIDSRVTLASSSAFRMPTFTYVVRQNPVHERDAAFARIISERFGIEHREIRVGDDRPEDWPEFSGTMSCNTYLSHGFALAHAYRREFPRDMLHVRSNIAEIGRGFYQKAGREVPVDGNSMARAWRKERNDTAAAVFARWADDVGFWAVKEVNRLDLLYWEGRMPTWHGLLLLESDIAFETHCLYNCRSLLENLLSVPEEDRVQGAVFRRIIDLSWRELGEYPIN